MAEANDRLLVIWSSADREVALSMVFMYTLNAKLHQWWDEVTLLVWGPSDRLLVEDRELRDHVKQMIDAGVRVIACKACADGFGVTEQLESLGIDVFYTGEFLTNWLKSDAHIITF